MEKIKIVTHTHKLSLRKGLLPFGTGLLPFRTGLSLLILENPRLLALIVATGRLAFLSFNLSIGLPYLPRASGELGLLKLSFRNLSFLSFLGLTEGLAGIELALINNIVSLQTLQQQQQQLNSFVTTTAKVKSNYNN